MWLALARKLGNGLFDAFGEFVDLNLLVSSGDVTLCGVVPGDQPVQPISPVRLECFAGVPSLAFDGGHGLVPPLQQAWRAHPAGDARFQFVC